MIFIMPGCQVKSSQTEPWLRFWASVVLPHSSASCRLSEIMEEPPRKNCRSRTRTNQTCKPCLMYNIQRRDSPPSNTSSLLYELYTCLNNQIVSFWNWHASLQRSLLEGVLNIFANHTYICHTFPNIVTAYMFVQAIDTISVFSLLLKRRGADR